MINKRHNAILNRLAVFSLVAILSLTVACSGLTYAQQQSLVMTGTTLAVDFLTKAPSSQTAADTASGVASLAQSYVGLTIPPAVIDATMTGSGSSKSAAVKSAIAGVITPANVTALWNAAASLYAQSGSKTSP